MKSEIVFWPMDNEKEEAEGLERIAELERLGWRWAWQNIASGFVRRKMVAPDVITIPEGEVSVDVDGL